MSKRTERVGSLIRRILAEALQRRVSDPRIPAITSITRVEVSPDFAVAKVMVSVMAAEPEREDCLRALRSAAGYLRKILGPELKLRKIPTLVFRLDESVRRSFETVQLIDHAMQELGEKPEWERSAEPDGAGESGGTLDAADAAGPEDAGEVAPSGDGRVQEDS